MASVKNELKNLVKYILSVGLAKIKKTDPVLC